MTRRLVARVTLEDPDTRQHVSFGPGGEVPGWAAALITNPLAWGPDESEGAEDEAPQEPEPAVEVTDGEVTATVDTEDESEDAEDEAPPRSGAGSGQGAWAKYARNLGLTVSDDLNRDDIIALVDAR